MVVWTLPNNADVNVLPSGSRSLGTPSLFCAMLKASSKFSRAGFPNACFMSTKVESIAFMIAKKARPLLQLLAKSWTATPYLNRITYSLHGSCVKNPKYSITIFKDSWKLHKSQHPSKGTKYFNETQVFVDWVSAVKNRYQPVHRKQLVKTKPSSTLQPHLTFTKPVRFLFLLFSSTLTP